MPTWGELLKELGVLRAAAAAEAEVSGDQADPDRPAPVDRLRRKYLKALSELTGRAAIVYETAWMSGNYDATDVGVHQVDVQGFMEAVSNVEERELDLIIHSPGGSAEAADAVIAYLRTQFDHIRAAVPIAAMSAATMMALACDEVIMGAHSQLGPIDPQLTISTPEGPRSAPGQAIIDQFERAKAECQDPKNIAAWLPILRGYGPGLLAVCDNQRALAEEFVAKNLEQYMFAGNAQAKEKAKAAAAWFADHKAFRSHSRRVSREDAREQGIKVTDLEDDPELQDAILSVHHAVDHTFGATSAFKIIENHHGRAFLQQKQEIVLQGPGQMLMPAPAELNPAGASPTDPSAVRGGTRKERRRQEREQRKRGTS